MDSSGDDVGGWEVQKRGWLAQPLVWLMCVVVASVSAIGVKAVMTPVETWVSVPGAFLEAYEAEVRGAVSLLEDEKGRLEEDGLKAQLAELETQLEALKNPKGNGEVDQLIKEINELGAEAAKQGGEGAERAELRRQAEGVGKEMSELDLEALRAKLQDLLKELE